LDLAGEGRGWIEMTHGFFSLSRGEIFLTAFLILSKGGRKS
jgi:hypothetical protein